MVVDCLATAGKRLTVDVTRPHANAQLITELAAPSPSQALLADALPRRAIASCTALSAAQAMPIRLLSLCSSSTT